MAVMVGIRHKLPVSQTYQRLRRRQSPQSRHHRLYAQTPHNPKRHPARPKTMATRLTNETVFQDDELI
jgi:hypothetical protein